MTFNRKDVELPFPDCRYFLGYKPCKKKKVCWSCDESEPQGERILIIKLRAMGDVLRTTPVLTALREQFQSCHITWVTDPDSIPLLEGLPQIDRLLSFSSEEAPALEVEEFDRVYCLDKEPGATGLGVKIKGNEKKGFGINRWGNLIPLNPEAQYALRLGLDNELKFFKNRMTYQEIVFRMLSLSTPYGPYLYAPAEGELLYGREVLKKAGLSPGRVVGLNTGCGPIFSTKAWTLEGYAELARGIRNDLGCQVLLLGGPDEEERNKVIEEMAEGAARNAGNFHSLRNFAGILAACSAVVTGDTIAMHLALALRTPVVAIFGATCPQEIDLYGLGEKVISQMDCSPCYLKECIREESCMDRLSSETVFESVQRVLSGKYKTH